MGSAVVWPTCHEDGWNLFLTHHFTAILFVSVWSNHRFQKESTGYSSTSHPVKDIWSHNTHVLICWTETQHYWLDERWQQCFVVAQSYSERTDWFHEAWLQFSTCGCGESLVASCCRPFGGWKKVGSLHYPTPKIMSHLWWSKYEIFRFQNQLETHSRILQTRLKTDQWLKCSWLRAEVSCSLCRIAPCWWYWMIAKYF